MYDPQVWHDVASAARAPADGFEAMLHYDDALTRALLDAAAQRLDRTPESLLEDLGTYLVSHPDRAALRRLLRFGGVGFVDFLHSIDDLPGRARLAVPDLDLPQIELCDEGGGRFTLCCRSAQAGFGPVLMGILRAMADDYGALVMLEELEREDGADRIAIDLLAQDFAEGKRFELAQTRVAGGGGAA